MKINKINNLFFYLKNVNTENVNPENVNPELCESGQYRLSQQKTKLHQIWGAEKISILMNKKFKDEGSDLTISHMTSWRILKKIWEDLEK